MPINAIAYAQFRLRGGARNILWSSFAYLAALGVGVGVVYGSTRPHYRPDAFTALASGLIALQVILFLIYGIQITASSVKADLTGGMIESHRLMPVSARSAVLGYLIGAPCQAYALFLANIFLGVVLYILEPHISQPMDRWMMVNAVLFMLGIFFFSVAIFWNMLGRNLGRYVVGFILIYWISRGQLFTYVPGLMLLASPALWTVRVTPADWVFAVGMGAQACVGLILLIAAAHKYRFPTQPAFPPTLGLVFLAVATAIFVMAIHIWPDIWNFRYGWYADIDPQTQFACSMGLLAWLGMIPVLAAVRQPGRLFSPFLVALLATVVCGSFLVVAPSLSSYIVLTVVAIVLIFEFTLAYLLRFLFTYTAKAPLLTFGLLALFWAVPFISDAVRYSASKVDHPPKWTYLATLSPFGSLFLAGDPHYSIAMGVAFQAVVLAVVVIAFYSFRRRVSTAPSLPATDSSSAPLPPPLPDSVQLRQGDC